MTAGRLIKKCIFAAILGSFSCAGFAAPVTYTLDDNHTSVLWHINHFGFSNPSGKWMASGTLILDKDAPQNDKVNATIQVASLTTGVKELDEHLQGKLFFDTAEYPVATFVSNKVDVLSPTTAKVSGLLTLRGVTKPVVLNVKLNKVGVNPISNKNSVGFSATATINRSDFGMTTLIPEISDKVNLDIEAEAYAG